MSNWPSNLQNICFKLLNCPIWNFAITLKLFIDHLNISDVFENCDLDLDLQCQIGLQTSRISFCKAHKLKFDYQTLFNPTEISKGIIRSNQCFCGVILQDHETNLGPERALNDIRQRVYADVYFINYS